MAIKISTVKSTLGESTYNLSSLCTSTKINKWSKYKPMKIAQVAGVTATQRANIGYGVSAPSRSLSTPSSLLSYSPNFTYTPPDGYYRLSDFDNYLHSADEPFLLETDTYAETSTKIKFGQKDGLSSYNMRVGDIYSASVGTGSGDANIGFGVVYDGGHIPAIDGNGNLSYPANSSNNYEVDLNLTQSKTYNVVVYATRKNSGNYCFIVAKGTKKYNKPTPFDISGTIIGFNATRFSISLTVQGNDTGFSGGAVDVYVVGNTTMIYSFTLTSVAANATKTFLFNDDLNYFQSPPQNTITEAYVYYMSKTYDLDLNLYTGGTGGGDTGGGSSLSFSMYGSFGDDGQSIIDGQVTIQVSSGTIPANTTLYIEVYGGYGLDYPVETFEYVIGPITGTKTITFSEMLSDIYTPEIAYIKAIVLDEEVELTWK